MEKPVLTAPMPSFGDFYGLVERVLKADPTDIPNEVKSPRRGRGGAGFPMGFKLQAGGKDADERTGNGTPRKSSRMQRRRRRSRSFSDRYLLEQRPHLVLLGMTTPATALVPIQVVQYIRAEYPEAVETVKHAVKDLEAKGRPGKTSRAADSTTASR
ncbi:MAG: hypothetical protein IPF64_16295 [Flavobacteriales bacterium]|nr:hypothetical protein [Flavobacteriales bacterium]